MAQNDWKALTAWLGLAAAVAKVAATAQTGHSLTCTCRHCLASISAFATLGIAVVSVLSLQTSRR